MRQKSYILKHWSTLFTTRPLDHCATGKGSFYTKNEHNLFYQKLEAKYFFIQQFFRKKQVFAGKNCEKLFWGHIWQFFRERRHLVPKISITFFTTIKLSSFLKKGCISWKNGKKPFLGLKSLLKGRKCLATKMNVTFFMGNEVLNIFHLTIFSKKATFLKKRKTFFEGVTIF